MNQDMLRIYRKHLRQAVIDEATRKKMLHKSKHQSVMRQLLQMRMNAEIRCSIKTKMAIKSGGDNTNRYTQLSPQKTTPKLNSFAIHLNKIPF